MAQTDAIEQLKERFAQPLGDFERRRIVFWHDVDGSFADEFDALDPAALQGVRPLHLVKVEEGSLFAAKRDINRAYAADDFLVYVRMPKDFSPKALEGNWLADVELSSEHFQADFASMLMDEIGATDSAVEGVEAFKAYFNAAERKERFRRIMPHAQTRQDVALGVIGGILCASDVSTETIIRSYFVALEAGNDPLADLGKFGADAPFASFVSSRLGYDGDLSSADDLASHLLLTAASFQLPHDVLAGLEGRISSPHGQFCLNVVHAWMADDSTSSVLYELARKVEGLCGIERRFAEMNPSQLIDADVFPCLNERILVDVFASLAQGADRADEADALVRRRKDLRWFSRVEPYFCALEAAITANRFHRDHALGFHLAVPVDVWKAYTSDWFTMDGAYRSFCKAVDRCQKSTADVAVDVDDGLDSLAEWIERTYTNWYLPSTNSCWVSACEKAWEEAGYVEGVARQRSFFEESVVAGSADVKKTLVIVSDALRYEVAAELRERLERDTTGSAELKSMQSVFPSITEFGMAALLPHLSMGYREADGCVYLDDDKPTSTTPDREAVLRSCKPKSRCIQSKELMGARRSERKEMVGDAEYVYVYHNKIDAIGENYSTEHTVFRACDEAIDDIVSLVKIATNDLKISRVVITADHGFLYTRESLDERDKVSKGDIDANVVKQGRRYMISDDIDFEDAIFIKMNMADIDGGSYTGLAPRDCVKIKKPGPGEHYVHGGVSLQECCVPVLQFRNRRTGAKGYEERQDAEFRLLSTNRRITSMLFRVELFQKDAVGGKVLPAEYELVMTDASSNEVSDIRRAHADMATSDETARVSRVQFGLKAGRQYDSKASYFLVCRNKATGAIAWREEYQIDIAFVPMDDFGF